MAERQLLTIGAFFITLVVAILLYAAGVIAWTLIVPVVLIVLGFWMVALAAMRGSSPQKYERTAFSTLSLGIALIVVGGAWAMVAVGLSWLYALALILIVLAALAIAAALRHK